MRPDRDFNPKEGDYLQFSHHMVEALAKAKISGAEFQVVFCLIRFSWGFKSSSCYLKRKEIIDYTGLSDGTQWKAMDKLIKRNIIKHFPQEGKTRQLYKINSKPSTWRPLPPSTSHRKCFTSHRKSNHFPGEVTPYKDIKDNFKDITVGQTPDDVVDLNAEKVKKDALKAEAKKQKSAKAREAAREIIDRINQISGKNFTHKPSSLDPIIACLNRGHTKDECFYVVDNKWADPDFKEKYFRPTTLFRKSLFEGYLNEKGHVPKIESASKTDRILEKYRRRYGQDGESGPDRQDSYDAGALL